MMLDKIYTKDEIVALLGGDMTNLRGDLDARDTGIWWEAVDDAHLQDLTDTERAALRPHPNYRPTTEPLLQFPEFTVRQFVAFEDSVHIFRNVYLVGEVTYGRDLVDKLRWPEAVRWTGLNEDRIASLRAVSPHAAELASALLNPPSAELSRDGAATPPALREHVQSHGKPAQLAARRALAAPHAQAAFETTDQRCARLLRELCEEEVKQHRGALARVVARDGRRRQTVSADIARAKEAAATNSSPLAALARIVSK